MFEEFDFLSNRFKFNLFGELRLPKRTIETSFSTVNYFLSMIILISRQKI